ncbi:MAG TPA: Gfo/Idh/MocA family oxidoreductase [Candidatus Acidoferrum sp.]
MKSNYTRRQFLQRTAATAGALAAANAIALPDHRLEASAFPKNVPPSDRLRFGIIGVGMEGSGVLSNAIALPGGECVAAADLYDERHLLAREITGRPNLFTTRKYKELLDNKEIDCILAAVPDHWHKQVVVDSVRAGKPIYCEKPMSHTAADGVEMVAAAKETGKIVQIGSQRVSSVICAKAREILAHGTIGTLTLVEGTYGRNDPNGAWEYPTPPGLSSQNFDWETWQGTVPKRAWDPDMSPKYFARWRCWREYGTGVAGDLLVHLVSGMMFMLGINEQPNRVQALGNIIRWKDGRNMPDVHAALYEYPSLQAPVYLRLNLGGASPETYRFYGSKGTLEVTEYDIKYSPQTGENDSPSYYTGSFPNAMRAAYAKQWHEENDPKPGKEPTLEGFTYTGTSWDELKPHLWNFFQAVRTNGTVTEDAVFGHHAALACHMANESYFRHAPTTWDAATNTIKS